MTLYILSWVMTYLAFSTVLAVYMYYDTLKDYKFRAAAKQFALAMYIWPVLLVLFVYAATYMRIREWRRNR